MNTLQGLVTAALAADAALQAAGVTAVLDGGARGAALPLLIVGPEVATPWGWIGSGPGRERWFTVTLLAADGAAAGAKAIMEQVTAAVLGVGDPSLARLSWTKTAVERAPDGRVKAHAEFLAHTLEG